MENRMPQRALLVIDLQNEYFPTGKLPLVGIEAATANAARGPASTPSPTLSARSPTTRSTRSRTSWRWLPCACRSSTCELQWKSLQILMPVQVL